MTRRAVVVLVVMTLAVALAIGVAVLVISSNSDKADTAGKRAITAQQTFVALCALRGDLERRVAASKKFLADNPEGVPGIPARTIRTGIDNQQRTVVALSDLNCP